ncbi:integrase, catalytic region, zinc finger, CCHC-type containing protein [Tanacetum coccineum]
MALIKEAIEIKEIFEQMEAEVKQYVVDKKCVEIERKNLLIENKNLLANCLSNELLYSVMNAEDTVWKATGKLFSNVGYQWNPTRKKFTLGEQCPLTRNKKEKAISTGIPTIAETQTIDVLVKYTAIILWYLDSGCSKHMMRNCSRLKNFVKRFIGIVKFRNNHFGAIMGYGDYMIDLEVAFKKHSCYFRDVDGVELLKGSRGSNLYTISVEDVMKSSPICLLSKASKNKSWLWHRQLNHLNFGTINDLARNDLIRGLLRLKFEKDHLCSACQLGKSKKYTHKPKSKNTIMEAEAIDTACYTQNRSLIHTLQKKTPYEFVHGNKLDLKFLCVFGALCYPANDNEDLGKLKSKADFGIFIGYAPNRKGYRIYNKRT